MCIKKHVITKIICSCIVLCTLLNTAYAKNLGVIGAVYPIEELDLLQVIYTQISANEGVFQKQWNEEVHQAMDRPEPIGLSRTQQTRTWFFDPSVTMPFDIQDGAGKAILSANQVINPLDNYSLNETLIFYDADDADQVRWAQQMNKTLKNNCKLILVGGSVANQAQLFHKPVYFDQQGKLTARFQFQHVPTLITQDGKRLKISEVLP